MMPLRICLLLTRPRADSERFAKAARRAGWRGDIVVAPLMEIVLHPPEPSQLGGEQSLVFTSQHGVEAVADLPLKRDLVVWAVGSRTADAARAAGFSDVHAAGGDAVSLLQALAATPPPEPILHLRGQHAASDIAQVLRANGHDAFSHIVYSQRDRALDDTAIAHIKRSDHVVLTAFSPRSASLLANALTQNSIDHSTFHVVAISAAAAEPLKSLSNAQCRIAARPDAEAMLAAIDATQAALEPREKPR